MISNVYSYYLSQYAAKPNNRQNSHKRSELKNIYNKMVSINRTSPLYKVDLSEDMQKLAIDIKEGAIELKDITSEISETAQNHTQTSKMAVSSDEEAVSAKYISKDEPEISSFEISVDRLASNQKNMGHFLQPHSRGLEEGQYSFDMSIADVTYEIQFDVGRHDDTQEIQNRISDIINKSNIGVGASVETDALGNTAISIESEATGVRNLKSSIFVISDDQSTYKSGAVDYLGLDRTVQYPANAVVYIDGVERLSPSNTFTVNKSFEVSVKKTTDEPVTIGVEEDNQALVDEIGSFVDSYNRIVDFARKSSEKFSGGGRLLNEFERIARSYTDILEKNGFDVNDDGSIALNDEGRENLKNSDNVEDVLSQMEGFRSSIIRRADSMMSNPMEYLDKKVVAYKNPARSFSSPYSSSTYAGIMFDGYY